MSAACVQRQREHHLAVRCHRLDDRAIAIAIAGIARAELAHERRIRADHVGRVDHLRGRARHHADRGRHRAIFAQREADQPRGGRQLEVERRGELARSRVADALVQLDIRDRSGERDVDVATALHAAFRPGRASGSRLNSWRTGSAQAGEATQITSNDARSIAWE